jgi:hypothetical protein
MKEEVEDTQKRLETVATGTVAMASDLVNAREASIRNEEFAKALLEQQASTSENEMRMLEHHISVANAALEQISGTLIFVCVRARVFLTKLCGILTIGHVRNSSRPCTTENGKEWSGTRRGCHTIWSSSSASRWSSGCG